MSNIRLYGSSFIAPNLHVHAGLTVGMFYNELSEDVSTNSLTWVDLLIVNYLKKESESYSKFTFSSSSSNSNQNTQLRFRLMIDDIQHRSCGCRGQGDFSQSATMVHLEPLSKNPAQLDAGSHIIKIQWEVSGGTGRIRPVTHSDDESASLLIEEILVP